MMDGGVFCFSIRARECFSQGLLLLLPHTLDRPRETLFLENLGQVVRC